MRGVADNLVIVTHPRRDVLVGVMAAAAGGASADEWGHLAAPYLFGVVALCAVWIIWDILWPRWRARRLSRQDGVIKIVGGFKSPDRREIRYEDGTEDVDVYAGAAAVFAFGGSATGTVTPATRWATPQAMVVPMTRSPGGIPLPRKSDVLAL